jgi:hypothetical protein
MRIERGSMRTSLTVAPAPGAVYEKNPSGCGRRTYLRLNPASRPDGKDESLARPSFWPGDLRDMTRTTNGKIAGFTFLAYIAAGITTMVVFGRATSGAGVAARLAGIAQHPTEVGIVVLLSFIQAFAALVLAVTLYAITREQDPDLAMLALTCMAN